MNLESPTSPDKSITHRITLSPERTISPINNVDGFNVASNKLGNSKENSPIKQKSNHSSPPRVTPPRDVENNHSTSPIQNIVLGERNGNSPSLQSFNSVVANLSPQHEKKVLLDFSFLHWFLSFLRTVFLYLFIIFLQFCNICRYHTFRVSLTP